MNTFYGRLENEFYNILANLFVYFKEVNEFDDIMVALEGDAAAAESYPEPIKKLIKNYMEIGHLHYYTSVYFFCDRYRKGLEFKDN
ncbi:uncharacterized protein LOC111030557 isoform X2 [Myzus persicae]|uniref:uncharacterized protein LOC111030557 isoform X2 n=1 Tax=Myzus persicae TaxID=13164 RepID=UPI000B939177|nr:uncharacterized protein LOC111030557 isoform X2 [Myzus persicae]